MKKRASKIKWERHFPPGFDWEQERAMFIALLSFSTAWCLIGFWARTGEALRNIRVYGGGMAHFYTLLGKASHLGEPLCGGGHVVFVLHVYRRRP